MKEGFLELNFTHKIEISANLSYKSNKVRQVCFPFKEDDVKIKQ